VAGYLQDNIVAKGGKSRVGKWGENVQGDGKKKVGVRMRGVGKEFPLSWTKERKRMRTCKR
jgi:hypothetical protein